MNMKTTKLWTGDVNLLATTRMSCFNWIINLFFFYLWWLSLIWGRGSAVWVWTPRVLERKNGSACWKKSKTFMYTRWSENMERTGTSCPIEIHFSVKNTKFLFKYTLLCSQIYDRFIILFIKHNHKVSASFIKEKQRYKWLKTAKWISILLLVPGLLLTVRSAGWLEYIF